MPTHRDYNPKGVIPVCLLPFHDDLSIDEASFRRHLSDVVAVPGLSAIFYAAPFIDRIKDALVLLGKLPRAIVQPPLAKLSDAEIDRIRPALVASGLLLQAAI